MKTRGEGSIRIWVPKPLLKWATTRHGSYRYRVVYGGRGSGKSFTIALLAAMLGAQKRMRILCTREFQSSIAESMMQEIINAIQSNEYLSSFYETGRNFIRGTNGTEFLFHGLRHNIGNIKSMSNVDLVIVEEAEDVPHRSWIELLPTIRAPKSEVWIIFNPKSRDSWVAQEFLESAPRPRTLLAKMNIDSNTKAPGVLLEQMAQDRERMSPALYAHIWEGAYYEHTDAQIFLGKWRVKEFEVKHGWAGPYYGLDFGFSVDPTACVQLWINDGVLYVRKDYAKVGLELDDIAPTLIAEFEGIEKHEVRADSSRPDTISLMTRGTLIDGKLKNIPRTVGKPKLRIEEGIEHMRAYTEIVVHPSCKASIEEFRLYSYKVDRLSGQIMPDPVDAHNHCIDAMRYALEPIIRQRHGFMTTKKTRGGGRK
jgi:phage terminase large subunit